MNSKLILKFFKFGIIGGIVYLFDAFCFWLLLKLFKSPEIARVISVVFAMTLSWILNRTFTFKPLNQKSISTEWLKFISSQIPGALVNATFSTWAFKTITHESVLLSVAIGSCAGLLVNFISANFFVYGEKKSKRLD